MENHAGHSTHLRDMAILGGVVAGVILAPYVLPAIGWGALSVAQDSLLALHHLKEGSGLAGWMASSIVPNIPIIGESLAQGGLYNAMMSAGLGLAAVFGYDMLPNNTAIRAVGKILKCTLLATSALIALPATLTGISNGLIFLATCFGDANIGQAVADLMEITLGTVPFSKDIINAATSAGGILPHLTTCGLAFFGSGSAFAVDEVLHGGHLSEAQKAKIIQDFDSLSTDQKKSALRRLHDKGHHGAHVHDGKLTFNDHLSMAR